MIVDPYSDAGTPNHFFDVEGSLAPKIGTKDVLSIDPDPKQTPADIRLRILLDQVINTPLRLLMTLQNTPSCAPTGTASALRRLTGCDLVTR